VTLRWITPYLATASADEVRSIPNCAVVDVRDLVDKAGNSSEAVLEKIHQGMVHLDRQEKTIICCDYGISRSNAIAVGILALHLKVSLHDALKIVQDATGEPEIKLEPLQAVQAAIEPAKVQSNMRERTLLVTGATGFIGSVFCKRASDEFKIVAPGHGEIDLAEGATKLSVLAADCGAQCVVHLANPRVYTSSSALGTSLTILRNVLSVCVSHDIHLVYPSSWEVYSGYPGTLIADEALPPFPYGPYGETKHLCEILIEHWRRALGLRCAMIRSGPVYGPGGRQPKFIYNFLEKAECSQEIVTHRYLNGEPALDLLYVADFCEVLMLLARHQPIGAWNIGTGTLTSTRRVAQIITDIGGSGSQLRFREVQSNAASVAMNYTKIRREFGWAPTITVEEGLKALIADHRTSSVNK
jgi:nucleoside-diphosphate-sugar epimerase